MISLLNNLSLVYTLQVSKIGEVGMWLDASTQIFYSLSLSFGGIITMSAGNDIRNNCLRDAIMVSVINCCTSLFAGIVIFSILGYKVINICPVLRSTIFWHLIVKHHELIHSSKLKLKYSSIQWLIKMLKISCEVHDKV